MRKLRLDLNQLAVESFSPEAHDVTLRGTVRGASGESCFGGCGTSHCEDSAVCTGASCMDLNSMTGLAGECVCPLLGGTITVPGCTGTATA